MAEADPGIGTVVQGELCTFKVGGLSLRAKRYGVSGGFPVIALHGWMDNCASFDLLAARLNNCEIICLDCAGHGYSDHRPHLGAYNIWQDIVEVFSVADQLSWPKFALLGHSRGAICSFLAAGTLPERITHLALIEGIYPPVSTDEQTPDNLASAVRGLLASQHRSKRYYDSFEQAVLARANGFVPVSRVDAEVLALHGTEHTDKGFTWRYDYRLSIGSEIRLNMNQVMAFQNRIEAKTLLIMAEAGLLLNNPQLIATLKTFTRAQRVILDGGHHLHMSARGEEVAEHVATFFN